MKKIWSKFVIPIRILKTKLIKTDLDLIENISNLLDLINNGWKRFKKWLNQPISNILQPFWTDFDIVVIIFDCLIDILIKNWSNWIKNIV